MISRPTWVINTIKLIVKISQSISCNPATIVQDLSVSYFSCDSLLLTKKQVKNKQRLQFSMGIDKKFEVTDETCI